MDRASDLFATLDITPVAERWTALDACWLFKIINKEKFDLPSYMSDLISFFESPYDLRKRRKIVACSNSSIGDTMFRCRLKRLYDTLPEHVWSMPLDAFRTKVQVFLRV